jgi:hypothetical protein
VKEGLCKQCPKCRGRGVVPIGDDLWRLFAAIRKAGGPVTSDALPSKGCGPTGLNNRLTILENLGLIQRVGKRGKFALWVAVKGKEGA